MIKFNKNNTLILIHLKLIIMSTLHSCPRCGIKAEKSMFSNWFPVHTCRSCGTKYCKNCGGNVCPECGSSSYSDYDKVYSD